MVLERLTWQAVWQQRLARHHLLTRAPAGDMAAVTGAVCGIHAQMMPAAELALGIRLADTQQREVRTALWEDRQIVKTVGLRGTLHLFPAAELELWMAALRVRERADAKRLARLGLDDAQLVTLVAAIGYALDGRRLTFDELGSAVTAQVGAWAQEVTNEAWSGGWPRWRMALGAAALQGRLCYGPPAGSRVTFVRADQWIAGWADLDPAAALATVLRRYLHAYGPATVRDFAQWFGIEVRTTQAPLAALGDAVAEVDIEGYRALRLRDDPPAPAPPAQESVRLLSHFDSYLVGCHPRTQFVSADQAARVLPHGQAGPVPVLLVDGVVAGVWQRQSAGKRITICVEPFAPLTAGQQAQLEQEAQRIGVILGSETTLTLGPITVRPHL